MPKHLTTLAALAVTVASCSDTYETTYANYAEAENDGAVARGWIPDFVPRNAHDIQELHNVDTNQQTLTFFIEPKEIPKFIKSLDRFLVPGTDSDSFAIDGGRVIVDRKNGHVVFRR
jgi:hypothetical protein